MGGGIDFPYRGEWNDLNGDGEVTYDELGLGPITGTLTDYFSLSDGLLGIKDGSDCLSAWSEYPSEYIAFPSSVKGFGAMLASELKNPSYPDKGTPLKAVVFSVAFLSNLESMITLLTAGYPFASLGMLYDNLTYGKENGYAFNNLRINPVELYLPGADFGTFLDIYMSGVEGLSSGEILEGKSEIFSSLFLYSCISSMQTAPDDTISIQDGMLIDSDSESILAVTYPDIRNEKIYIDIPSGIKGFFLQDMNFAVPVGGRLVDYEQPLASDYPSEIHNFPSSAYREACYNEMISILDINVPDGIKLEYISPFVATYQRSLLKEQLPNLKYINTDMCYYPTESSKIVYDFDVADFKNAEYVSGFGSGPSVLYSGAAFNRINLYEGTKIDDYAFNVVKCDELHIYGDVVSGDRIFNNNADGPWYSDAVEMHSTTDIFFHQGVTKIPEMMFNGLPYYGDGDCHTDINSLSLPLSLLEIGDGAFANSDFHDNAVIIPEGVRKIGSSAFFEAKGGSIFIPAGVEEIGTDAFYNFSGSVYTDAESALPGWEGAFGSYPSRGFKLGYTLEEYAAEVGITIPEGFTGGTLPSNT